MDTQPLFVKFGTGRTLSLSVSLNDSVEALKAKIAEQVHVSPKEIAVMYAGKVLVDGNTLDFYKVGKEAIVHATRICEAKPKSEPSSSSSKSKGKEPAPSGVGASTSLPMPIMTEEEIVAGVAGMNASKGVDICFAFDTTGSMAGIIRKVRSEVKTTCERLMRDIPGIRISIMIIGDYCDQVTSYVVHSLDFSNNPEQIKKFVSSDGGSSGGDFPEAYEWALYKARKLSWRDDPQVAKALVMISDAIPHERWHTTANVHWQEELAALADFGVRVYGVQASNNGGGPAKFNARLAERSGGLHLQFTKFHLITTMFLALCYKEAGKEQLENFREEVKKDEELGEDKEMQVIMEDLANKEQKVEKVESKIVCHDNWYTGLIYPADAKPIYKYIPEEDLFVPCSAKENSSITRAVEKDIVDHQFKDLAWRREQFRRAAEQGIIPSPPKSVFDVYSPAEDLSNVDSVFSWFRQLFN